MSSREVILLDRNPRQLSTWTLRDIVEVGMRRRRSLATYFTIVFLGAAVAAAIMPRRYESELKVLVNRERADPLVTAQQNAAVEQNMPSLSEEDMNSEVALLRSEDLLEKVVTTCGLDQKSANTSLIGDAIDAILAPFKGPENDHQVVVRQAAMKLNNNLRIEPLKKSFIISIRYTGRDPQLAARVLNTLGDLYLEKHAAVHRPANASSLFDQQSEHYRRTLQDAEEQLAKFNQQSGLVTGQSEKDTSVPKLAEFELDMHETQTAIPSAEQHVRELETLVDKTPPRIVTQLHTSDNGALLQQLRSSLVNLEQQKVDLTNKYAPGDRMVQEVNTQIEQVKGAIEAQEKAPLHEETSDQNPTYQFLRQELAKARADLASLRAKAGAASRVNASYRSLLMDRDQKQLQQEALIRDVKAAEANYLLYLNKREEARISEAFDKNRILNVSIAQPATVPFLPVNPLPLMLLLGWLLACLLSMGLVFVQERLNPLVRSPRQIEHYLDVPVLADLPEPGHSSMHDRRVKV